MSDEGFKREFFKEAFDTNWIAPLGKNVNELSKMVSIGNALPPNSDISAIHLDLKATRI